VLSKRLRVGLGEIEAPTIEPIFLALLNALRFMNLQSVKKKTKTKIINNLYNIELYICKK
jgi:hypothetical protein